MISTYLRNKIQDYLFRGVAFTPPTTYYVAISKTKPNIDGSGVTEPVGGNYARVAVTKNTSSFSAPSNGTVLNANKIMFNESTSDWGVYKYYAIYDSLSGGNLLWGGLLSRSRTIEAEMQLFIDVNGMSFTLGGDE